jgi:hypothetical protein
MAPALNPKSPTSVRLPDGDKEWLEQAAAGDDAARLPAALAASVAPPPERGGHPMNGICGKCRSMSCWTALDLPRCADVLACLTAAASPAAGGSGG